MDDTSLGGVVRSLHLRDVDNGATHRRSGDEAAVGVVLERLAINGRLLLVLAAPVACGGASAVEGAVKVGADDLAVVVNLTVGHGALGPGDAGVGNEDVEAAVELLDDLGDGVVDSLRVRDVDLVGAAWGLESLSVIVSRIFCLWVIVLMIHVIWEG